LAGTGLGGEMNDRLVATGKHGHQRGIANVAANGTDAVADGEPSRRRIDIAAVNLFEEAVDDRHGMSAVDETRCCPCSDEAGPAGNQDLHCTSSSMRSP
jgi:hypothetical protein